jgi:hypothetical protein
LSNDCQALKRDNSEILHTLHTLSIQNQSFFLQFNYLAKQSQKLALENENLSKEMSQLKKLVLSKNVFPNYPSELESAYQTMEKPKRTLLPENQISTNENEL